MISFIVKVSLQILLQSQMRIVIGNGFIFMFRMKLDSAELSGSLHGVFSL